MSTITCIETYFDSEQNYYGCFLIEPLEIGQGITLGNALRRTLLSDLTGFAVTGARINNLKHEFAAIEGVREDVLEILLNLKNVIFKSYRPLKQDMERVATYELNKRGFGFETPHLGFIRENGPRIITASMFHLPKDMFKIINPKQYICTLVDDSDFYLEIDLECAKGYRLNEETRKDFRRFEKTFDIFQPTTLKMDAVFSPVKKVNYKVKLIHDSFGNIKESLSIEIVTNGSISPKRSIQEATKILMKLFYSLFLTPSFLNMSSRFSKQSDFVKEKQARFFKKNEIKNIN
jgi:DNA-directed RNA polymerase subunit alpha